MVFKEKNNTLFYSLIHTDAYKHEQTVALSVKIEKDSKRKAANSRKISDMLVLCFIFIYELQKT